VPVVISIVHRRDAQRPKQITDMKIPPSNHSHFFVPFELPCISVAGRLRQKLQRKAADGELVEEELQVGLQHAYHRVNFAWNVRRISTSEYSKLTQSQFESWGRYPTGIKEL
jgi:hypothetical protein